MRHRLMRVTGQVRRAHAALPTLEHPSAQYGLAVLGVALVTLIRLPFEPLLHGRAPYGLYFPLLVALAWYVSLGPSLLALLLSWLSAWYFFVPRPFSFVIEQEGYTASFVLYLVIAGLLTGMARMAAITWRTALHSLHESEKAQLERSRLAAIVDSSEDAIIAKDLDGLILSWNQSAQRMFGYSAEEIIGRSVTELMPAERSFEEGQILARVRRGERVEHFETVRIAKDGRALDISLSVSPVRDAEGQIVGAAKIARDISERKRAERAAAEQREWLRVTLASIGDAVITTGRDGTVTYMNAVAERLTGFTLSEAGGQPLAAVFHVINEQSRERVEDPHTKVIRAGCVIGLANHSALIARGGRECSIEDSAAPIINDRGETIGVVLVFHDVTERRRAEVAIAQQREWLETTLVSIGDAVIATDIHGRLVFMNPVAEHLTGWRSADGLGQDCSRVFNIVNENTRAAVENPVSRVLREGAVVGLANHTLLIARDGTERPIDDSAAPIRDPDGRVAGVVLVFHDVSERRRAERERQRWETERERLLECERSARAEAERANRVKDQFMATVSHELRTPLNAILGWAEILKRGAAEPATLARGVTVIERNARAQAQLVSDLLDVSRAVSGKLKVELQLVDLANVVEEALETVRAAAEAKGLQIERAIERDLEPVAGDPVRLQQIVWNLLSNAVKFTPAGGRVRVTLSRDKEEALFTVSDTGAGIRAEFLPHLFERFSQADASTTRRFGGLGLGLAIVKQLVTLHRGSVGAHSEGEGKGAMFEVRLPLDGVIPEHEAGTRAPRPLQSFQAAASLADQLAGLQVLLVEDEADARELVERFLSEAGCRVIGVGNVEDALRALRAERPDLLISDIGLPGEDGYTLIQRIRALELNQGERMPAIALTAFARAEDRTRALRAGFQAHLTKPIDPAELLATLASFAHMVPGRRPRRA